VQWEGLGGLYKGVASPLAGQMFFRASLFGAFGSSKRWLATNPDGSTRALRTADFYKAGAMTGFVAAFTEGPIDFYKSQIQVQIIRSKSNPDYTPPYTTVGQCVRATIRENGFKGPFQGLGATLLRNTPANAVYLGTFEVLKRTAAQQLGTTPAELPAWVVLSSAGLVSLSIGWVVGFSCWSKGLLTGAPLGLERSFLSALCSCWEQSDAPRLDPSQPLQASPEPQTTVPLLADLNPTPIHKRNRVASATGWPSSRWTASRARCRPTRSSAASGNTPTSAALQRWVLCFLVGCGFGWGLGGGLI